MACVKCNGSGSYRYDEHHVTVCDFCCQHVKGWWLLAEHYGEDNDKLCCLGGCGLTVENDGTRPYTIWENGEYTIIPAKV